MDITWFTAARAIHFASCLLILGVCWFDRFVIPAQVRRESSLIMRMWGTIAARLMLPALPIAAISGAAWFALTAMSMNDSPLDQALQPQLLRLILRTRFGELWQLRLVCWFATALAAVGFYFSANKPRLKSALIWLTLLSAAALVGSLAWSGHGQDGNPAQWHLLADTLHLIVASVWPMGLLPFGILLLGLRRTTGERQWSALSKITSRFSAMNLAAVAMLAATGFVNSCYMMRSFSDLFSTNYGNVLLAKIILFLLAVIPGAFNLIRLKPRLEDHPANIAAKLQITTALELIFGTAAVIAVALLGTLPPG